MYKPGFRRRRWREEGPREPGMERLIVHLCTPPPLVVGALSPLPSAAVARAREITRKRAHEGQQRPRPAAAGPVASFPVCVVVATKARIEAQRPLRAIMCFLFGLAFHRGELILSRSCCLRIRHGW